MNESLADQTAQLQTIVQASPALMAILSAARSFELASWCIGAGAVRNLVWDHLHDYQQASPLNDVDLVYFEPHETVAREHALRSAIDALNLNVAWDLTNQAQVHKWYEQKFRYPVPPLQSLREGVASWPEYATCVGVSLNPDGRIDVLAPYGLDDLFALRVRHNPARASRGEFESRHRDKRWKQRWPKLKIS